MLFSIITVAVAAFVGSWLYLQPTTQAADMSKFDPGNIISDAVMSNKNALSVQQIQSFLDSKNTCNNSNTYMASWYPHLSYNIQDGKFVCLAKESFNGESAAQIVWKAAQDYDINPQVLIVLLEKEQGLITDTWPNSVQYRSATGYGCPDTAPCDTQYYGLKNQVRLAASMFRTVLNGGWSNYPVGHTYVQYHPNTWCGGSVVNIKNRATSALYRYTPYQPNASALAAGYGTGDECGAYGNRNFWALFTDWFGNPVSGIFIDIAKASQDITSIAQANGQTLGRSTSTIIPEYDRPRVWQDFEKGVIVWTPSHGAKMIPFNSTHSRWKATGGSLGDLGTPTSNPVIEPEDGRIWQDFNGGTIIYHESTSGWELLHGPIMDRWRETGGSRGVLGKPTSAVRVDEVGGRTQSFENGIIYRKDLNSPAFSIEAGLYEKWKESSLGTPISNQTIESDGRRWQDFENGTVISSQNTGTWEILGGFHTYWKQQGGSLGRLGKPTGARHIESDGRRWQDFENVRLKWHTDTGWRIAPKVN